MIRQLNAIKVAGRQFTSLDPDWIRLHPADNRRLEGSYDLYLQAPSDSVLLLGALSGAGKVSWQPGKSVREYPVSQYGKDAFIKIFIAAWQAP